MENNILNQVEQYLKVSEAETSLKQMKDYLPTIVGINKSVYEEMKKQGFSEEQSFKFSCEYTLKTCFPGEVR